MNTETRQAEQFHANFQRLDRNIDRLQRKNMDRRNFCLIILLQLSMASVFLDFYFVH
ncbi:hypothetical protein [Hyella patelloides]|uniref:hypothetical protein n=1 Tax=Hyella patelloides TaxID=1982969 RepID=UPI001643D206|nr:hypothetical protein [Hyella patelloides]